MDSIVGMIISDSDKLFVNSITLFVALLCACIVIARLLEGNRWINESIITLVIGLFTGFVLLLVSKGKSSRIMKFDEEFFFMYLLPPIIFNAGFKMKKKQFFKNFMTIMLFGVVGTMMSFCIISFGAKGLFETMGIGNFELRDYLAIGAILSATDSVCTLQVLNQDDTPLLYSLVFGEGVVNDAASVVLFNAIQKFNVSNINSMIALKFIGNFFYLFATSTVLGATMGLLSAYVIKKLHSERHSTRHSTNHEVALMILMAYLSYILAELFGLSGILTVFLCGIVMSHYTWHNVTENSRVTTKHTFAAMSHISEVIIFLYVGMDALDIEKWTYLSDSPWKSIGASLALLCLVLVGRASFVFPLSVLSNWTTISRFEQINFKKQVIIWWAGLMRGAVSLALVYNQFMRFGHTKQPGNAIVITCTITVVLFTTVVFGSFTKLLIRFLLPRAEDLTHLTPSDSSSPRSLVLPFLTDEQKSEVVNDVENGSTNSALLVLLSVPTTMVHYYWRKFDDSFMRPMFGGDQLVFRWVRGSSDELRMVV